MTNQCAEFNSRPHDPQSPRGDTHEGIQQQYHTIMPNWARTSQLNSLALGHREDDMSEIEVTCQVCCQKCGWNVGATILADESNVLEAILKFVKGCWPQHLRSQLAGELLVAWKASAQ